MKVAFPKQFPRLETKRLVLREITPGDCDAIFKNFSDPEIASWFFEVPYTQKEQAIQIIEAFKQEFEQGKGITWAITLRPADLCIGTCGFGTVETGGSGEIGFDLAKEHWGHGIMVEALIAVITYGFKELNLNRIEAHTYSNNVRAIRLLERLGMHLDVASGGDHNFSISRTAWLT